MNQPAFRKSIPAPLGTLAKGKKWHWGQIAALIDSVERHEHWQGESASFTEWVEKLSASLGVQPATLWRFFAAGRFYASLRTELSEEGTVLPRLEELPAAISPENLELLAKLRRVAPQSVTEPIARQVLSGSITRADLRSTWQAYRPALDGRTARGRGVEPPKLDATYARHFDTLAGAEVFTCLKTGSRVWTGTASPHTFKIYLNARPEFEPDEKSTFEFDAVVAVRCAFQEPLVLHAFDIRTEFNFDSRAALRFYERASPFCDRLWIAVHGDRLRAVDDMVPKYVGVVVAEDQSLEVVRSATQSPRLGARSGDLAKGLLFSAHAK